MNYAVLFDLGAEKLSFATFENALEKLDGKPTYIKFYGYNAKRNSDYTSFARKYSAHVAVPLSNRKKVRIDIRQVIDAVMIAGTNKNIDAFFIICAQIDAMPMIMALKEMGKKVVLGTLSNSFLADSCDSYILLDRSIGLDDDSDGDDDVTVEPDAFVDKIADSFDTNQMAQDVAATSEDCEDNEFLPLTKIIAQNGESMNEVKVELAKMIDYKREQKKAEDIEPSALKLDELIKKYF